jgi:methenyltetrahydrofolate cyclohydrolase
MGPERSPNTGSPEVTMDNPTLDYFAEPLRRFVDDAAATAPTPGGGSVSAMVAVLGTTMAQMSAGFTLKGKKYAEHHPFVQPIAEKLARAQQMLRQLVAEDIAAYGLYSEASTLPKDDPTRPERTRMALATAIAVPEEIIATAVAVLREVEALLPVCNPYLVSDLGAAAIFCEAAARAAALNVWVNLAQIDEAAARQDLVEQVDGQLQHALEIRNRIEAALKEKI